MLLDEKELEASAQMDPSIVEFTKRNPMPPTDWSDWQSIRTAMATMLATQTAQLGPANPDVLTESYIETPLRDGHMATHKVFRPIHPPAGGSPLVVFAFGGGFISGDQEQGTPIARMLTKAFGVVVVCISYRLAPQHRFPCAQLDAWDAVKWLAEHAGQIGADPAKGFIMSGISAGGTITSTVVTQSLVEPLAHPFTGQWLAVPSLFDQDHIPEKYRKYHLSLKHNKDAPVLCAQSIEDVGRHTQEDRSSPWRFPIKSSAPLSRQPKAFITADGMDPLRDDALIWDEILKDNGVETMVEFYPGCPHAHWGFYPGLDISNKAVVDIIRGLGWLLGENLTPEEAIKRGL